MGASQFAPARQRDILIVVIDQNHLGGSGSIEDILPLHSLAGSFKSLGWQVGSLATTCPRS